MRLLVLLERLWRVSCGITGDGSARLLSCGFVPSVCPHKTDVDRMHTPVLYTW